MKFKSMVAASGITALIAGAAVLGLAAPADAHTPDAQATCEALTVDLKNYSASTEGTPGTDAVYQDIPHHDLVKDATPAVPEVTGAVKWVWNGGNQASAPSWTGASPWNQTSDTHPNHNTQIGVVYQQNNNPNGSWVYWQSIVITPGQDAQPAQYNDWVEHKLITPAKEGTPAKTNHVTITDNGASLVSTDFSTSYNHVFQSADKTIAHDYSVVVTAYDDPQGYHGWTKTINLHVDACELPPLTPVTGTISITVTPPTCDALFNTVLYDIPVGTSVAGYTGKGSVKAEDLNLGYGVKTYPVDVAEGYVYEGPSTVSFTLVPLPSTQDCTEKPANMKKHVHNEGQPNCTVHEVSVWDADYENEAVWNDETQSYEFLDTNWQKVAGEESTRKTTAEECPATVVTPPTNPTPTESAKPASPEQVALVASEDVLASTGSNVDVMDLTLMALALAAAGGFILVVSEQERRRRERLANTQQ